MRPGYGERRGAAAALLALSMSGLAVATSEISIAIAECSHRRLAGGCGPVVAMRTRDQSPVVEQEGLYGEQTFHAAVYESQAPRARGDGDIGAEVKVRVPREARLPRTP